MEVLGLKNDKLEAGTNVIVENSNLNNKKDEVFQKCQIKKDEQTWYKGVADPEGWFTLRNLASGKFLTASHRLNWGIFAQNIKVLFVYLINIIYTYIFLRFCNSSLHQ